MFKWLKYKKAPSQLDNNAPLYCIKDNYTANLKPKYYLYEKTDFIYQPDVYTLALTFMELGNFEYIIDIGSGSGEKLKSFDKYKIIAVDYSSNRKLLEKNISIHKFIDCNLETDFPLLTDDIIKNSVIILSDVIEHLVSPEILLKNLARISHISNALLISTPDRDRIYGSNHFGPPSNKCHVREWNIDEFDTMLKKYNFNNFMIGHTINTTFHKNKTTILAITGQLIYSKPKKILKILAIIHAYNEDDIIEQSIIHLLHQGVDVCLVDNHSTDNTYEIALNLQKLYPDRIILRKFGDKDSNSYEWEKQLDATIDIATSTSYDWIIHHDVDEIRFSPFENTTLLEAISFVDEQGYTAINFTAMDFRPTKNHQFALNNNLQSALIYFEFGKRPGHFLQVKAWKNIKNCAYNLSESGGHDIKFNEKRVFPIKFLLKHYPIRSTEHGSKKVFKERLSRFTEHETNKGWHCQYKTFETDNNFIFDENTLTIFNPENFAQEYFVERISGINIL